MVAGLSPIKGVEGSSYRICCFTSVPKWDNIRPIPENENSRKGIIEGDAGLEDASGIHIHYIAYVRSCHMASQW